MPNWKKIIVSGSDASLNSIKVTNAVTASEFTGSFTGSALLISASIGHLETIYETASVIYSSGSTKFGDTSDDTHERTGSLLVSGAVTAHSFNISSNAVGTPSIYSDSNINLSASNAVVITSSPLRLASFTNAQTGSITAQVGDIIYNSDTATYDLYSGSWLTILNETSTASLATTASHTAGTASIADLATTASHALNVPDTASHALTAITASHTTGTASIANTATSASHTAGTASIANLSTTASIADELSGLATASIANTATTASHTAGTASISNIATTSSYSLTGDGIFSGSFSGSFIGDASNLNVNPFPFTGSGEMQGELTVESFQDYIDEDYVESYFAGTAIRSDGDIALTGSIFGAYQNANSFTGSFLNDTGYIVLTEVSESLNFADDSAAQAGGVPLGGLYRNGSDIKIRIT